MCELTCLFQNVDYCHRGIDDVWSSSWVKTTQWWSACDFFYLKKKIVNRVRNYLLHLGRLYRRVILIFEGLILIFSDDLAGDSVENSDTH